MNCFKQCFYIILLGSVLAGCYSARKYPYALSEPNKATIKQVFMAGKVSCSDGYCWQIVNEGSDGDSYFINGKRVLFMEITLKAKSADNGKAFVTYMRIKNLGFRLRDLETLFLEELGERLFNENKTEVETIIKGILKEQEKKAKP